jgi:hypothetical protein
MQHQSLFGHLATKFGEHPENLATESLNYIINSSIVAKKAFSQLIEQTGVRLRGKLNFQTQAGGDDNAVPDLVGTDIEGKQTVITEAKFWAGLTDKQPIVYLNRLPRNTGGILLFIAPAKRSPILWSELLRRCQDSGLAVGRERSIHNEFTAANVTPKHVLAVVSWRSVLLVILAAVESEAQTEIAADVRQLLGLCERMDDNAFLPLRSEELTPQIGARVIQFSQLVNDVTDRAVRKGIASVTKLRQASGAGWSGRYMKIYGQGCCLYFDASAWSRLRETPIWFSVKGIKDGKWEFNPLLKDSLSKLESEQPSRLFVEDDWIVIPFFMPLGVERDRVADALYSQLLEIAAMLRTHNQRR